MGNFNVTFKELSEEAQRKKIEQESNEELLRLGAESEYKSIRLLVAKKLKS